MHPATTFELPDLTKWRKSQLMRHATEILTAQQHMGLNAGNNIIKYLLRDIEEPVRLQHYPNGDRIDKKSGAQYFYHCHREDFDSQEHGHFHCFLRYSSIPKRIKPTPIKDWDKHIANPLAHLIAIAMDCYGNPIRLFTVNRWVSAEIWYDAQHAANFTRRFKMNLADDGYWMLLDQWIDGMLHLFAPQIIWLHQERDKAMSRLQADNPTQPIYDNRAFEELSEIAIDLKQQIQWIIETPYIT